MVALGRDGAYSDTVEAAALHEVAGLGKGGLLLRLQTDLDDIEGRGEEGGDSGARAGGDKLLEGSDGEQGVGRRSNLLRGHDCCGWKLMIGRSDSALGRDSLEWGQEQTSGFGLFIL